jgi:hypothetical protein
MPRKSTTVERAEEFAEQREEIHHEAKAPPEARKPRPAPTPPPPSGRVAQTLEGFRPGPIVGDVVTLHPAVDAVVATAKGSGPGRAELRGITTSAGNWKDSALLLTLDLNNAGSCQAQYTRPATPVPEMAVRLPDDIRGQVVVRTADVAPRFPAAVRWFVYPLTRKPAYRADVALEMRRNES